MCHVLSGPVRLDRSLRIDLRDSPSQARHLGCPGVPRAAQKPGTLRLFRAPDSSPTSAPGGLLATSFFPKFHVRAPASGAAVGAHSAPRIRGAPRCIRGARLVAGRGTSANRVLAASFCAPHITSSEDNGLSSRGGSYTLRVYWRMALTKD